MTTKIENIVAMVGTSDSFISADKLAWAKSEMMKILEKIPTEHRLYIFNLANAELEEKARKAYERSFDKYRI